MNRITIDKISVSKSKIEYEYSVFGEWQEAFRLEEKFFAEYNCDISEVPEGVAVIPLLANLLPMSWVYDAEIVVSECDRDFYESIPEFKRGYAEMYPMLSFGGTLTVREVVDIKSQEESEAMAFFSGGVDAFNTLVCHMDEKPALITVWGADIKLNDEAGWERVLRHLEQVREEFSVGCYTVKSSFRVFLNEGILSRRVVASGDGWWHGFQHGLGMYAISAPLAYLYGVRSIYFASSFTIADKGIVPCASDPTIDDHVRFCGASIHHDGYQFTRQQKIENIISFSKAHEKRIFLRVCWESAGGSNCCQCEKCWRTILGICAEGADPREYGLDFSKKQLLLFKRSIRSGSPLFRKSTYRVIQKRVFEKKTQEALPKELRWFCDFDVNKIGHLSLGRRVKRKIYVLLRRIKHVVFG